MKKMFTLGLSLLILIFINFTNSASISKTKLLPEIQKARFENGSGIPYQISVPNGNLNAEVFSEMFNLKRQFGLRKLQVKDIHHSQARERGPQESNRSTDTGMLQNTKKRTLGNSFHRARRTKRTLGKFFNRPNPSWFNGGHGSRPTFNSGGFNRASPFSSFSANRGTDNNWVHYIPELFPNMTPRPGYTNPEISVTSRIFPPTRHPWGFHPTTPKIIIPTTEPPVPSFTTPEENLVTIDSGFDIGYTFSDGRPLTLNPDAETLSPLL